MKKPQMKKANIGPIILFSALTAVAEKENEKALLDKISLQVRSALEGKSEEFKTQAEGIVNNALSGLNLEALRSYSENKENLEASILKMANGLEKIQNRTIALTDNQKQAVKSLINERMGDIEAIMTGKSGRIELNVREAVVMDTANVIDYAAGSAIPDDILESFSVGEFVPKRRPREYIFDIASRRTVNDIAEYKTWLEEGSEEGFFAIVAEGALKPLVSLDLVRNVSKARKVAGKRVYTDEVRKFRREAYNIIEDLIRDKLIRDYQAILTVDLLAAAASYVGSALDGQYANPTDYHAIAAVAAQIEALDFLPDVLIMNPQDKWRIGMSQDTSGQFYLAIPTTDPSGETRMMGFVVRTSNRVPVGTFILGESNLWKIEDEAITVKLGYGINVTTDTVSETEVVTTVEHDLDHNRFRIIAETFFHSYIATNHTGSFVVAEFAVVKALLQAPEAP